ncbi:adenine deaminase [Dinghuibacter silviterrae]|uniref:Adenine deaminase n=1 Tax=Dinghuibacter silviterrae TaxID=1539049 RepID=A0A4R8DNE9_9BACT|nr:adenine deaminase [Dinghuibacter silviterrae]TDW99328.1 adenine deaminase [Dinghuibacter silviterrae]
MKNEFTLRGRLVDIPRQTITRVALTVYEGKIARVEPLEENPAATGEPFICPGFVDAHVHIESSMLVPSEFARLAVVHGTVATVSDPHEIANVCGLEGVNYMIANGRQVPFTFCFGAPSCVPATVFETAGATLSPRDVETLLEKPEIGYLSEMMNFPGVLAGDPDVLAKIASAHRLGKPVDGHAPGLRGEAVKAYIDAGISTDHECFTMDEALDKLRAGMHILIREGSAARNFDALVGLLKDHADKVMFCSDDKHPDSLVEGHINQLCARAVAAGMPVFHVLRAACVNPVTHYRLAIGQLREGDPADFILLDDLKDFHVRATYIRGEQVSDGAKTLIESTTPDLINKFQTRSIQPEDLRYPLHKWGESEPENFEQVRVIEALDGQLITNRLDLPLTDLRIHDNVLEGNPEKDILKMVVVNRYQRDAPVAKAFVKNFGLRAGAIASTVAHDSHNIIAVGTSDEYLAEAIRLVIDSQGGISCVVPRSSRLLPLPIAGLMSPLDGYEVARAYTALDQMAKDAGSRLSAPFMTLSFMALLVIPHLKLSDKGLFDGDTFTLI